MVRTSTCTVVGVFNTRGHAERAMDSLRHAGFPAEQIGVAGPGEEVHADESATAKLEKTAESGAVTGAVTGTFGLLISER